MMMGPGGKKRRGGGSGSGGHSRSSSTGSTGSNGSGSGNVDPAPNSTAIVAHHQSKTGGAKRSRNNSNPSTASTTRDRNDTGIENIVLVTKWGDSEIIGALVMRVFKRERKAVIRAWTVKMRYRGNGVGRVLLEEAVRASVQRGCVAVGGKGVEFEGAHASEFCLTLFLISSLYDGPESDGLGFKWME
ncbi:MAG: hypothetical protein L6R41_004249 [Letrouitia leprolyta]|nr:MAG: hypothetical protein L6R41_004249 [Letrouitia leprolyta]